MKKTLSYIEEKFYKGEYEEIVNDYEQGLCDQSLANSPKDFALIMGAYSFLGRLAETERLLHKLIEHHLPLPILSQCQFYYVLLLTRLSHYRQAREQIVRLLMRRNNPESESRFYGLQALSFYRYYQGRYQDALTHGLRALKSSRGAYESFLAKDLLGHIYCQQGWPAMGDNYFQGALALAATLGLQGFEKMVALSVLGYQIERAENLLKGEEVLLQKLKATPGESFYSRSSILLTLAKIYRLKGERDKALEVLNEASLAIFRHHNRRHMALLYLNMAYIDMLSNSYGRALQLLEVGLSQLDPTMDFDHQLKLKGLKYKILLKLGISHNNDLKLLREQIENLTIKVGTRQAQKILDRDFNHKIEEEKIEDDRMAQILRQLKKSAKLSELGLREWENIYHDHLLSLIDQTSESEQNKDKTLFIIGKIPKSFIVGKNGNYQLIQKGVSPMTLSFCKLLSERKSLSKEEITTLLYGHDYHPLNHDPLIHGLIARVRKNLANFSGIIQNEDGHYLWSSSCILIDCSEKVEAKLSAQQQDVPKMKIDLQLNIRQHKLLERARGGDLEIITPGEYRKLYQVSRITATRDLTELCELGHFYRLGKARSITYIYENDAR